MITVFRKRYRKVSEKFEILIDKVVYGGYLCVSVP